jgi:modification methylase
MPKRTRTSAFGVSNREGHDSSQFYNRELYRSLPGPSMRETELQPALLPLGVEPGEWVDRIYLQSSESMPLLSGSAGLAFTSPPYNNGKEYDNNLSLEDYLGLVQRVAAEVYRVLRPGGRYVVNVANLGRKPYIPLHAYFYQVHAAAGFMPMGEIIWQKSRGSNSSCAWGSWKSARSPRLRDVHEYLLVFAKQSFTRPDHGTSDISAEEFMEATLSIWSISPVSARKTGHPAPFPIELAERVIKLFSFTGDLVVDPFCGSGTTCVAARQLGRHYAGFDISPEYCALAEKRLADAAAESAAAAQADQVP